MGNARTTASDPTDLAAIDWDDTTDVELGPDLVDDAELACPIYATFTPAVVARNECTHTARALPPVLSTRCGPHPELCNALPGQPCRAWCPNRGGW